MSQYKSLGGQIQPHGGDNNVEMAPQASKKKLIISKKLSKYVRLEKKDHGDYKMIVKEPRSPWVIINVPKSHEAADKSKR